MPITPRDALQRTIEHREIFHDEMCDLMRQIMRGEISAPMVAAILTGLRVKKETVGEIVAAASVMREMSARVHVPPYAHFVDIVGTGGDSANTFNISTASMFVAAAAGAKVAKHGNRSVSSKSGSADVLEALGAVIDLSPQQVAQSLQETGIGFMFAPIHHPAMKAVAPVRREMGVRTLFNILGPLTNPAGAPNILMGVFHPDLVGIQVRALQRMGVQHALVVWGKDGMDEISLGECDDGRRTARGQGARVRNSSARFRLRRRGRRSAAGAKRAGIESDGAEGARWQRERGARHRAAQHRRGVVCRGSGRIDRAKASKRRARH